MCRLKADRFYRYAAGSVSSLLVRATPAISDWIGSTPTATSEGETGATVRAGEDQHHTTPTQLAQGQLTAPIQSRQPKLRRHGARFQAITLDLAASQGTITETIDTVPLTRPRATLSPPMGEGLGVRAGSSTRWHGSSCS